MSKSAGILLYRRTNNNTEVFLGHPGGPYYKGKDDHSWGIPKGTFTEEDAIEAARREFKEETGFDIHKKISAVPLTPIIYRSGNKKEKKTVFAWAIEGDLDESKAHSNMFEMEWPPRSGKMKKYPELDRYGWFTIEQAKIKITKSQLPLVWELSSILKINESTEEDSKMEFNEKDAKLIGDMLKVDWNIVCIKQFTRGLNVELEHGKKAGENNVTNDDPIKTAKIALAHLDEKHNYYELLDKAGL
jgi:predicted NUDIX family NTP pyrophosphohydrolase